MYPTIVIRCQDENAAQTIFEFLQIELVEHGYFVKVDDGESVYYGMSNLAEDISGVKMLTIDPVEDDE